LRYLKQMERIETRHAVESCRPSQPVRSLRVNKRMSLKTARKADVALSLCAEFGNASAIAKALGLTVPGTLLVTADEVIE
jgi:hypothetical protein